MKKYLTWGTGKRAENNLKRMSLAGLSESVEIVEFVDNATNTSKDMFHDRTVYAPADICKLDWDFIDIWVASGRWYEEL